jgi:hypothetical protein
MDTDTFLPIPTCEIPPPILERATKTASEATTLPRVLLQEAGSSHASRRVIGLAGLFLLVALFEVALLLRLPPKPPVVVYGDFPRILLMETLR